MSMKHPIKLIALTLFALTSCGGGGGGGGGGSPPIVVDDPVTFTINANASPATAGSVVGNGSYDDGTSVSLIADPNVGYNFVNWTENATAVSTSSSYPFTATANRTLVANFALNEYTVTAGPRSIGGFTAVIGGGVYNHGDSVSVVAEPGVGYALAYWTGDLPEVYALDGNWLTITVTADLTLTAHFIPSAEIFNGTYKGVMKSPNNVFKADLIYTTIDVSGSSIVITRDHFQGNHTCIFSGELSDIGELVVSASGTYECSDFTSSTWTSTKIAKTAPDAFIAEVLIDNPLGLYLPRLEKYEGFLESSEGQFETDRYFYDSGDYMDLNGEYHGYMKSSGSCSNFWISSHDTTITISNEDIEIVQDSFFEGVCIFTGTIEDTTHVPLSAGGTFMCSNFDEGTWTTTHTTLTGTDSFFAELIVEVPERACSYAVKYSGFK